MRLLILFLCSVVFTSCYNTKRLIYLRDNDFSKTEPSLVPAKKIPYRIQPFDVLSVQIKSSVDREISGVFNLTSLQNSLFATPGNFYIDGYSVDANGKINLPVLGELAVSGMTLEEIQKLVQTSADAYLKNATVIVKLTSFKVTVLGEVKNPGQYFVYNNQATVLEAIGMAGDLTTFGNRKKIKLIRPVSTNSEVVLMDLTKSELLRSEYFFLKPGDVLYIEPLRIRSRRENIDLLTVLFSAATTTVLVLSYIASNE